VRHFVKQKFAQMDVLEHYHQFGSTYVYSGSFSMPPLNVGVKSCKFCAQIIDEDKNKPTSMIYLFSLFMVYQMTYTMI